MGAFGIGCGPINIGNIVINEMRQRYLNSVDVIEKLLIEEGVRLEYMIKEMEYFNY